MRRRPGGRRGGSTKGVPHRPHVRLPDDAALADLWRRHGGSYVDTAAELGCSPSAVGLRIRKMGLEKPPRFAHGPVWLANQRIDELEELLTATRALLDWQAGVLHRLVARVDALERSGPPSSRRIVDGGEGERHARRRRLRVVESA